MAETFSYDNLITGNVITVPVTVGASQTIARGDLLELVVTEAIASTDNGVKQVETATVVGAINSDGAGNATVVVTAAGMNGSPVTLSVAVANSDTASQVATKIRTAMNASAPISAFFTVGGTSANVILTAKQEAANDTTMNVSIDNGTCAGLTTAATSANTTAGVTDESITGAITRTVASSYVKASAVAKVVNTYVVASETVVTASDETAQTIGMIGEFNGNSIGYGGSSTFAQNKDVLLAKGIVLKASQPE